MSKVRVNNFSISLDGYGAGPDQCAERPFGVGGSELNQWIYSTKTFQSMFGKRGGTTGPDDDFATRGTSEIGAWILGRNMFGPVRGPWLDDSWKGWWGETPPYHTPVFVLTHHAREPFTMHGGTTFYFVTEGIQAALDRAREAAMGQDIRIGGGVSVIREYLQAALIDEMHLVVSPILLGSGEHLLTGIDTVTLGYEVVEVVTTSGAMHVVSRKS